jgi:hypothetical protein
MRQFTVVKQINDVLTDKIFEQIRTPSNMTPNIIMDAHMTAHIIRGEWLHVCSVFTVNNTRYRTTWNGGKLARIALPGLPLFGPMRI